MKKLLNDILFCHELTITQDKKAWITNYEIDYNIAKLLIISDIIEQDSGNFETGEKHYIINFYSMTIFERINKFRKMLNDKKNMFLTPPFADIKNQLLKDLDYIEIQYSRMYKLKKIEKNKII